MRVLIACEFSGRVRDAFLRKGHDAYSCDYEPTWSEYASDEDRHIIGDVTELLKQRWDLVIAHPPCTYLCNSGVCHLHYEKGRWEKLYEGCRFFLNCLNANADKICVENPIMHKYARSFIRRDYTQIIQPYEFGEPDSKATCLWLKGLPELKPTKRVHYEQKNYALFNSGNMRSMLRSLTYHGIARAMAEQWG